MFSGCSSLTNINLSNFNTQNVIDMSYMFYQCSSLKNVNISNFNTQNVKYIKDMFDGCSSLPNKNLPELNTQNVDDMSNESKSNDVSVNISYPSLSFPLTCDFRSFGSSDFSLKLAKAMRDQYRINKLLNDSK